MTFYCCVCYSGDDSAERTHLSPRALAQCKLLLYGTLVKHYSNTNRPPLLPQHMTDVYTAITDLLGENAGAELGSATKLVSPLKLLTF